MAIEFARYSPDWRDAVLELTRRAWAPVFRRTSDEVPRFVYDAFYPDGWETRQDTDVAALLQDDETDVRLAIEDDTLCGFVGIRFHPEDRMGEVAILAVDPDRQGRSIGRGLLALAEDEVRAAGYQMVMVETVGDSGHAPARRLYEGAGYQTWPVARYFKKL